MFFSAISGRNGVLGFNSDDQTYKSCQSAYNRLHFLLSYTFGFSMSFEDQVQQLTSANVNEIETHYYAAIETEHGSGEHWILMAVLDKYGFRTNSPTKAMEVADQIIILWYTLNS